MKGASKTGFSVDDMAEYQWKVVIPVNPDTTYCYRVGLGGTTSGGGVDLLGSDPSPQFTSQVAADSPGRFSFIVFGDWGQAYFDPADPTANANQDQTNVLAQMAATRDARFAVMTGDTGYLDGSQVNYGDLQQIGENVSGVFGPTFWAVPGRSLPVFNVTGNHGYNAGSTQVLAWPEQNAASGSDGSYRTQLYQSVGGSRDDYPYPAFWYAFDAGRARFYELTGAWGDGNGSLGPYATDAAQHWTPSSAEYRWLQHDLANHPRALKFAFWHYPLYSDTYEAGSDTYLQGAPGTATLQGLLDAYHVNIVFNGHAHGYERNAPDAAGMVSYVFGNGGADLGPIHGCSPFDLYAVARNGTHCGSAPAGLADDHIFGFAKVTVHGQTVTVTPTDEMGRTYDVQTYTFPDGTTLPPTPTPTPTSTTTPPATSTPTPTPTPTPPSKHAQRCRTGRYADRTCTPGARFRSATRRKVCAPGYGRRVGGVSATTRRRVFHRYGAKPGKYKLDHLIAVKLGGSNAGKNLWPMRKTHRRAAHAKKRQAARLHRRVCSGAMTLQAAQRAIVRSWSR